MKVRTILHVHQGNRTWIRQAVGWDDLPRFGDQLQLEGWLLQVAQVRYVLRPGTLKIQEVQVHASVSKSGDQPLPSLFVDGSEVVPS